MPENTITVNFNNLTDEERKQLLNLVGKSHIEKKNKVWKPNKGETYYYVNDDGSISETGYNSYFTFAVSRCQIGNCFKTREEAKFAVEKQKLIVEIKRYISENDPEELDWNNYNQFKVYINYNYSKNQYYVDYTRTNKNMNAIYFSNKFNYQKMIEDIGESRIKKYLFEAED